MFLKMNSIVCMCMLLIGVSSGASVVPFPNVYKNIEQHEIIPFIKLHLMLGYSALHPQTLQSEIDILPRIPFRIEQIPTPNNFDLRLLQWTTRAYGLSNDQVYKLARDGMICFDDGCINVGDVGSICCT